MTWDVEFLDEFETWWNGLNEKEQDSVAQVVGLLEEMGPHLVFPFSSKVIGSAYGQMRELRIQHEGRPYRVLYAFDLRRAAVLLLGGDKTGNDRWYLINIPIADGLLKQHLANLEREAREKKANG